MARLSHDTPVWRVFGAALGAFALGVQLLLFGWFLVEAASAADLSQADLAAICTHDPAATADHTGAPPAPPTPHQHSQCPACVGPQSAKLLAPLPTASVFVVLRPSSQSPHASAIVFTTQPRSPSPYTSRAPPLSA